LKDLKNRGGQIDFDIFLIYKLQLGLTPGGSSKGKGKAIPLQTRTGPEGHPTVLCQTITESGRKIFTVSSFFKIFLSYPPKRHAA
jgi:hypothetical protein